MIRTWTVIDWCNYNSEQPNSPGRYVHTQIIKVVDNTPPTIHCPEPVTANVGPNCTTAYATLGLPTSDDCSTQIAFSNDSPYATSNGANASGTYPVGTTTVRFVANDGCSNNTACTTTVTIADTKAPNIACILGLTVTLMNNGAGVSGSLNASALVASSSDNCTPLPLLKYTINRPGDGTNGVPTATVAYFDCYDANAAAEVQVWATDNQNNSASCTTVVMVQSHGGTCIGQTNEGMIAGGILTENGHEVENVMIMVSGETPNNANMYYTQEDGGFMFQDLSFGRDYSVTAQYNEQLLNGVTSFDLILIGKHVLGTRLLDSPFKIIAADVDRSGHISTLDIIKLRKLILNIDQQLPNGNTSWRFIDASYVFPDPSNPFMGYFPEIYNFFKFLLQN